MKNIAYLTNIFEFSNTEKYTQMLFDISIKV